MDTPQDIAREVVDLLQRRPVRLSSETLAQEDIEALLGGAAQGRWTVHREYRIDSGSIIDFALELHDRALLGVEAKVNKGQKRAIWHQVERYAASGRFAALVLATNKAIVLPRESAGVPILTAHLGRAWI